MARPRGEGPGAPRRGRRALGGRPARRAARRLEDREPHRGHPRRRPLHRRARLAERRGRLARGGRGGRDRQDRRARPRAGPGSPAAPLLDHLDRLNRRPLARHPGPRGRGRRPLAAGRRGGDLRGHANRARDREPRPRRGAGGPRPRARGPGLRRAARVDRGGAARQPHDAPDRAAGRLRADRRAGRQAARRRARGALERRPRPPRPRPGRRPGDALRLREWRPRPDHVESMAQPGPFAVEVRKEPKAPPALVAHPLAAARLLGRMSAAGLVDAAAASGAQAVALDASRLKILPLQIPANTCAEVIAALDAGGAGVNLRLVDTSTGESSLARARHIVSDSRCAGASPVPASNRAQARRRQGRSPRADPHLLPIAVALRPPPRSGASAGLTADTSEPSDTAERPFHVVGSLRHRHARPGAARADR